MHRPDVFGVVTIGHSTLSYENFLARLNSSNVTALADIRSVPFSRQYPQFNRNELRDQLRRDGIAYVFLGKELGGRPADPNLYSEGVADYEKIESCPSFGKGLDRIIEGMQKFRIALMCSEQDPLDCHRCLLVGRALARRKIPVTHLLQNARTLSHVEIEDQLLAICKRDADDLFASREERLGLAYRERAKKVAFTESASEL
jgi:uncharacterized protein (DUF488 family)